MTETWFEKEECPYYKYSRLFNNCTIDGSTEFRDTSTTSIEDQACKDEADAVDDQDRACLELLNRNENVVSVAIDALTFGEGALEHLCWNEKH